MYKEIQDEKQLIHTPLYPSIRGRAGAGASSGTKQLFLSHGLTWSPALTLTRLTGQLRASHDVFTIEGQHILVAPGMWGGAEIEPLELTKKLHFVQMAC